MQPGKARYLSSAVRQEAELLEVQAEARFAEDEMAKAKASSLW